jgi:drug/metabolite transporter (DMT)-like permease
MNNFILYMIPVAIWGSTWLAIRFQLGSVAPELSVAYRMFLASAILLVYCRVRRISLRFDLKTHGFILLQAAFLFSLNYFLVYNAEQYIESGLVAVIFSAIIFLNILFGAVFLKSPVRVAVLLGASLGVIGLGLIFWPELRSSDVTGATLPGLTYAIVGTILASLGNIISARNQRHGIPVVQTNAIGMGYGALIVLAIAFVGGAEFHFDLSAGYVASLLYLALFGSVIAFGSYLTLLGRIGSDRAAYAMVLFPIIALGLSTLFEGLSWSTLRFLGLMLAVAGNLVALGKVRSLRFLQAARAAIFMK